MLQAERLPEMSTAFLKIEVILYIFLLYSVSMCDELIPLSFYTCFFVGFTIIRQINILSYVYEIVCELMLNKFHTTQRLRNQMSSLD